MLCENAESARVGELAKGQIWKTGAADIEVLGVANGFVHYKVTTRMGRRLVSAQISGLAPMADYLKLHRARLAKGDRNHWASMKKPTLYKAASLRVANPCLAVAE